MEGYRKIKSEEDYQKTLEEHEYVFVIFSATWCGPCKNLKKMIQDEYKTYPHPIVMVDVDEFEDLADGVQGLPTIVGFHQKNEVHRVVGFKPDNIKELLDSVLNN